MTKQSADVQLDSDSDKNGFQDLVIKFSNLTTLLEPGAGRFGVANEGDICHKIGKTDSAVIVGVSAQDHLPGHSIGSSAENDARVISDICKLQLGMKPSRVKLLTAHTKKPTQKNIKSALKDVFRSSEEGSLVLIYFSGHGHIKKNEHYLIPQDFRQDDVRGTGISAENLYKWLSKSKARKIIFLLDCCFAELLTEAMYREKLAMAPDHTKHVYLLASSEVSEPSISDEVWLEHGYMTFLIKHYFNFVCASKQQVAIRDMTRFIRKYTEPLSRFTYTVYDGQVCQRPVLAHLGPEDHVETDASEVPPDPSLVDCWRGRIKKTRAYTNWWKERLADAKIVLSEPTFSYSQIFFVLFLNGLHSICIILCEEDMIHEELVGKQAAQDAFCVALQDLVLVDLGSVTHESYVRYNENDQMANPKAIIQSGMAHGVDYVTNRPSAPPVDLATEIQII